MSMISRESLEAILIANGVSPTAPDEEIKMLLVKAQWIDHDITTAITVLRENEQNQLSSESVSTKRLNDDKLDQAAIADLLNITVDASHFDTTTERTTVSRLYPLLTIVALSSLLTVIVAAGLYYSLSTSELSGL